MTSTSTKPNQEVAPVAANNVYDKKKGDPDYEKVPCCMYFYYITLDTQNNYISKHYYFTNENKPIHYSKVQDLIIELAKNAKLGQSNPPQYGANGKHLVWTRVSYIAFFVDIDDSSWIDKGIVIDPILGLPNHTFFDGYDTMVTIDGKSRPIAWCINYMKGNALGADLGHANQPFHFALQIKALLMGNFPDSGGTNMGPPVPPP